MNSNSYGLIVLLFFTGRFLKRLFEDYDIYSLLVNNHKFPKPVANIFADFLESLLNYNSAIRPTALDCLKHPFMTCDYNYSSMLEIAAATAAARTSSHNQNIDGSDRHNHSNTTSYNSTDDDDDESESRSAMDQRTESHDDANCGSVNSRGGCSDAGRSRTHSNGDNNLKEPNNYDNLDKKSSKNLILMKQQSTVDQA
ncbi:hypothetical protein BLA29_011202, partial [Euroglyphus maynei]